MELIALPIMAKHRVQLLPMDLTAVGNIYREIKYCYQTLSYSVYLCC